MRLEKMLHDLFRAAVIQPIGPFRRKDAIYDSESMCHFARVELGEDSMPIILSFRH
jgi:hypothetical protein